MVSCANCDVTLDPAWKFCVRCGIAVSAERHELVPNAIRAAEPGADERERISPLTLFGWSLTAVVAIVAVVAIMLFLSSAP